VSAPQHLSERQLAAALLPGATMPTCPVPGCTACPARLAEQAALARQFHDDVLPRTLPALRARAAAEDGGAPHAAPASACDRSTSEGLGARLRSWLRPRYVGPLAAAAALLVFVAVRRSLPAAPDGGPAEPPYLGVKGAGEEVHLHALRGGAVERLADGARVAPGDALRFSVDGGSARGPRYALVVSIDGAAAISVYAPFGGDRSLALDGAGAAATPGASTAIELPGSVILDDTLGDERIWALVSDAPIEVLAVRPALERLAAAGPAAVRAASAATLADELGKAAPGVRVTSWLLRKAAR
jgi:hypothetical protein